MKISDYNLLEKIDETKGGVVYRGIRQGETRTVIIKTLNISAASPADIAAFHRDYDIITHLDCKGMVKTFQVFDSMDGLVLVQEDFRGISARQLLNSDGAFDMAFFLDAAMKLAQALGEIHAKGVIHGQVKPQNILINKNTGEVKLTCFGAEALITHENDSLFNHSLSRKSLLYLSPEQTGRLNRRVGSRSDLYSLGVVFYEMLTGEPPFRSEDPFELIHAHISKDPVPPVERRPDIPEVLSDMVMKLLRKEADDRYQDGMSLRADLEQCDRALKNQATLGRFQLGKTGRSNRVFVPGKLYGRKSEYQALMAAIRHMDASGRSADPAVRQAGLILVNGEAGTGKSTLVNEIRPWALESKAYVAYGKFEPLGKNVPYSAIIQAFECLIRQVLEESEEDIGLWKQQFLSALGPNAKIMLDLFPGLECIIGAQPDVPELGLKETRSRFNLTFERLVAVFASKDHPVVLLIDNMHWADRASLNLLFHLLARGNARHLVCVGLYRGNGLNPGDPFPRTVKKAEEEGVRMTAITLGPLGADAIAFMIHDFLAWGMEDSRDLAEYVHDKTGGNPFFIHELLNSWMDHGLIDITKTQAWTRDAIERADIPSDLGEMLAGKIQRLAGPVQDILEICACMGIRFEPDRVARFTGRPPEDMDGIMWDLARRRLIRHADGAAMFSHDLIHDAVYGRMDDRKKAQTHDALGKFLLGVEGKDTPETALFQAVDHLNLGRGYITDPLEKERLCALNLACARKAKNTIAYASASAYLSMAMSLLNDDSWTNQYVMTLSIHRECIEIASLMGERERMNYFEHTALDRARTIQDKALVYRSKIAACSAQEDVNEALSAGFFFNSLLGLKITGARREMILRYIRLKWAFFGKSDEDILALPDMTDPLALAALDVGSNLGYFLFTMSPQVVSSGVLYNVARSLDLGLSPQTAFNYCVLGLVLISRFGRIDEGYRFGKLGMKLTGKPLSQRFKSRAIYIYYSQVCHWKEPLSSTLEPLKEGYRIGVENGDPVYAADNLGMHDAHLVKCGCSFTEAEPIIRDHCIKIRQLNQEQIFYRSSITHQFVLNMMGKCGDPFKLKGEALDEDREIPKWIDQDRRLLMTLYWYHVLTLCVVFDNTELGMKATEQALKHFDVTGASLSVREFRFMDSLIRLSAHAGLPEDERKKNLKRINENLALIKTWTRHASINNLHMYRLIQAEKARVLGRYKKAETLYGQALSLCRDQGWLHHEMLVTECAAKHYLLRGRKHLSWAYRLDTIQCCRKLGAIAKLNQIRESFPEMWALLSPMPGLESMKVNPASGRPRLEPLQVPSVVDTCRKISGEILLAGILKQVLHGALMHTEATRCFIVLNLQGRLHVAAEGGRDIPDGSFGSVAVDDHGDLPAPILKHAARAQQVLVLDNAAQEGEFTLDPYVVEHLPLSILCYPVMGHEGLMGIIYLEHDGLMEAFTPNRVDVVGMMGSQMAVSMAHALHVENLNDEIRMLSGNPGPSVEDPDPVPGS